MKPTTQSQALKEDDLARAASAGNGEGRENKTAAVIRKRLDEHDKSRIVVQKELEDVCSGLLREIDEMEEEIAAEIENAFEEEDTKLQKAIQRGLSAEAPGKKIKCVAQEYFIEKKPLKAGAIKSGIALRIEETKSSFKGSTAALEDLSRLRYSKKEKAKEKLWEICNEYRKEVEILGQKINADLEEKFTVEDSRLQSLLIGNESERNVISKLIVGQTYSLAKNEKSKRLCDSYNLLTAYNITDFKERKPKEISIKKFWGGKIFLSMNLFSKEEQEALDASGISEEVGVKALIWEKGLEKFQRQSTLSAETARTWYKRVALNLMCRIV